MFLYKGWKLIEVSLLVLITMKFNLGCALFNAMQGYDIETRKIFYKAWPSFNIWKDLPIKERQLTCLDWGLYLDFEMFTKNVKVCKIWNCMGSCKVEPLHFCK